MGVGGDLEREQGVLKRSGNVLVGGMEGLEGALVCPEPGQASSGRPGLQSRPWSPGWGGWGHGQARGREWPLPGPRRQDGTYTISMNGTYVVAASFQTETVGRVFPELGTIRRVSEGGLL